MTTLKDILLELQALKIGQEKLLEFLLGGKVSLSDLATAANQAQKGKKGKDKQDKGRSKVIYAKDKEEKPEILTPEDEKALQKSQAAMEGYLQ